MELSVFLKALGDPTRFLIYQQLLIRKHCTRSLSKKLGFSEAAISQHLKILREAGLVYREKYGYHTHYLPSQESLDYLAKAFEQMREQSLTINRDPKICQCEFRQQTEQQKINNSFPKEDSHMRIAVTYDNGNIYQHFGHTEQFKLYDIENNNIVKSEVVSSNGFGHGALAGFLKQLQTDILICGGIGVGAQNALSEAGIRLYAGCEGSADDAAAALITGTLQYEENPVCDHHGEHHDHDCGGHHGSGEHKCGQHENGSCHSKN